jgi:hypothetical protein
MKHLQGMQSRLMGSRWNRGSCCDRGCGRFQEAVGEQLLAGIARSRLGPPALAQKVAGFRADGVWNGWRGICLVC